MPNGVMMKLKNYLHSQKPLFKNVGKYVFAKGHSLFFALGKIKSGEELTISYLLSPGENCKPAFFLSKINS